MRIGSTLLTVAVLVVIMIAVIVGARHFSARRKQMEAAAVLQSQLSDIVARESQLHGLIITPRVRVSGWRATHVTLEVAGEVPTPELRETVMRVVGAEAWRLKPGVITLDHLFIVPPMTASATAARAPR
jgi:hypothetical protein